MATPSVITTPVTHGSAASATFNLSAQLTDVATVKISLTGSGAPSGID
ncbi:MAG: hypothetical protein KAY82_03085 [Hylemonella sp.]|nr:hypothetical protein [Hylemonella sp.]